MGLYFHNLFVRGNKHVHLAIEFLPAKESFWGETLIFVAKLRASGSLVLFDGLGLHFLVESASNSVVIDRRNEEVEIKEGW
jgi:hypothetical protein